MSDHPFGIPRGTIEDPAFQLLRAHPETDSAEHNRWVVQLALLYSIATSLMQIREHQEDIARNTG